MILSCALDWIKEYITPFTSEIAILISIFAVWYSWRKNSKSFELSEFNDEYGNNILHSRNQIKIFIGKIAIFINGFNGEEKGDNFDKILKTMMDECSICANDLIEATGYFDENFPKKKKKRNLSPYAREISETLFSILKTLYIGDLKSENWKQEYNQKIESVKKELSNIHSSVSKQKKSL